MGQTSHGSKVRQLGGNFDQMYGIKASSESAKVISQEFMVGGRCIRFDLAIWGGANLGGVCVLTPTDTQSMWPLGCLIMAGILDLLKSM